MLIWRVNHLKKMKHFDIYYENSLKRMDFRKVNGQWTKVDDEKKPMLVPEPIPRFAGLFVRPVPPISVHLKEDHIADIVHHVIDEVSDRLYSLVESAVERVLAKQHS